MLALASIVRGYPGSHDASVSLHCEGLSTESNDASVSLHCEGLSTGSHDASVSLHCEGLSTGSHDASVSLHCEGLSTENRYLCRAIFQMLTYNKIQLLYVLNTVAKFLAYDNSHKRNKIINYLKIPGLVQTQRDHDHIYIYIYIYNIYYKGWIF